MNIKVNITTRLRDTLNILSEEYNFEIAGYLTGEIKEGQLFLDDILIPDQNFGIASVEINPEHQVGLLKKYGRDKCKRVIGHWHSHHNMGCFWSGTDYVNMKNIMCYEKLFIFIVSSKGNHLVKVCMREPLSLEFDEVDLFLRTRHLDYVRRRVDSLYKKKNRIGDKNNEEIKETYSEEDEEDED